MILSFITSFMSGDGRSAIVSILLCLPAILFALSLHETAHGFVAWKCGDPTAHNLGRLTLNPIAHLDPLGFLCMLLFGFGWAKPVPINSRYFGKPRRDLALVALAGPVSNLLLGIVNTLFATLLQVLYATHEGEILYVAMLFFYLASFLNFSLAIFNLIPIPPFDGSRIFSAILPWKLYFKIARYERQIMWGVLIVLFGMSYLFDFSPSAYLADLLFSLFGNLFIRFWVFVLPL